jgi:hypothetical protein
VNWKEREEEEEEEKKESGSGSDSDSDSDSDSLLAPLVIPVLKLDPCKSNSSPASASASDR